MEGLKEWAYYAFATPSVPPAQRCETAVNTKILSFFSEISVDSVARPHNCLSLAKFKIHRLNFRI